MTLHALIIAINTYDRSIKIDGQYAFGPLEGCVRDAQALHDWLKLDPSFTLNAKLLLDQDATKTNIVAAFREHLSQAAPGDAILLFYSGHGTIEIADAEAWQEETDGRLEGLACYYEQGDTGKFILADKELRYLLKEISQPDVHIAALFDCCHSGDNTRAAAGDEFVRKQGLITFQQRQWSDFIFSDKLRREDLIGKKVDDVIPEGRYIKLAASESNEPAIEAPINRERHGVFAYFLLEMLRENGGHISYRDLCNRIRNRIRYKYGQRVKIEAPRDAIELEASGFLKKAVPDISTGYGTVDFNPENMEYRINRGIIDRVVSGKTTVHVVDTDGSAYSGRIGRAELNAAEVVFDGTTLSKLSKKAMDARMEGLASRPLQICLVNKDLSVGEAEALSKTLFSIDSEAFILEESDEKRADYTLVCWAGMYYFTKPDNLYQPVVMPVLMADKNAPEQLLSQLKHMAQWHLMLDLRNDTQTKIPTDFLQVEILGEDGGTLTIQDNLVEVKMPYTRHQQGKPVYSTSIKVKLTNNGLQDIYVAPLLLMDYGCWATLLTNPDSNRPIEPGNSELVEMNLGGVKTTALPFALDATTRIFNFHYGTCTLKFMISLSPINGIAKLDLKTLPLPEELLTTRGTRGDTSKGAFAVNPQTQTLPDDGWNALNIEVRTTNPLYNTPDWDELNPYMDVATGDPYLTHFFKGLYPKV